MAFSKNRRLAQIISDTSGNLAVQGLTVPTQSASDNDTSAASTAYVTTAVAGLIDSAPDTLNTLNEIAAALNDDANFNTTVTNSIAAKLPLAGGTLTGNLTIGAASDPSVIINDTDSTNPLTIQQSGANGSILLASAGTLTIGVTNGSGSDKIALQTKSTTRLHIEDSGEVGLGTTSPAGNLHVVGATSNAGRIYLSDADEGTGATDSLLITKSGTTSFIYDRDASSQLRLGAADDNDILTIDGSNARVGIGTTSPTHSLHVNSGATNIVAVLESTDAEATLRIKDNTGTAALKCRNDFRFNVSEATELMRLTTAGHLLLGATSTNFGAFSNSTSPQLLVAGTMPQVALHETDTDKDGYIGITNSTMFIQTADAIPIRFGTSDAERMRIDSSGNVGIGTNSPSDKLEISGSGSTRLKITNTDTNWAALDIEAGGNQANYVFFRDDSAERARITVFDSDAIAIGNGSSTSERMRIDGSGRFAIGVTNPEDYYATNLVVSGASEGGITLASTSTSVVNYIMFADGTSGDARYRGYIGYNHSNDQLSFASAGTQSAYIDSGQRFTFGGNFAHTTYGHVAVFGANSVPDGTVVIEDFDVSSGIGNTVLKCYLRDQDPATSATFIRFGDGGGSVGSITHNDDGGGVTYNTTSDYRLKENVDYDWDATTLLKQLKPCKFNFKKTPDRTVQGMLAHEVKDIVPYSVRGDKDHMMEIGTIKDSDENIVYEGVYEHFTKTDEGQTWTKTGTEPLYQVLDYSRLVPLLTKALQEADDKIDALTARVATLEG